MSIEPVEHQRLAVTRVWSVLGAAEPARFHAERCYAVGDENGLELSAAHCHDHARQIRQAAGLD
jgi:hypothetical protein